MNTYYLPLAQGGFVLLSLVYFALLVNEFRKAVALSAFSDDKKKKINRAIIIGLGAWTIALSGFSLSGVMSDFSKFPFNFMPVIAIPLITMIVVTVWSAVPVAMLLYLTGLQSLDSSLLEAAQIDGAG